MKQFQLFLILGVLGLSIALPVSKVEEKKEEHKEEAQDDVEVIYRFFAFKWPRLGDSTTSFVISCSTTSGKNAFYVIGCWLLKQLLKWILFFLCFIGLQGVLEYERYLKEIVGVLETDPQFRAKLDNASEVDVRVSVFAGVITGHCDEIY